MTANVLRQRYLRQFRGLTKYSRAVGWFVFGAYAAQIVASVALGHLLLSLPGSPLTVAGMVALAIFIGTRLRGLNNIVHECSHATFTAERADNTLVGRICAAILMGCFADYRDEHLTHHAHLGDYEHDLDLQRIEKLRLHEPLSRAALLRHLTNPFLGRHLPYYLRISLSRRDGGVFLGLKVALLAGVAIFTVIQPATGLIFLVAPFALVLSTLNYWADCLDHAGLTGADDDLDASRNLLVPYWLRVLFFPRNDCFHLVHHLFPQIPARHLSTSHEVLAEDRIYQSKQNAIRLPAAPQRAYHKVLESTSA